ncbi:DUF5696 domain-containing protein [Paenibacillus sp. FA6]|uniref:DUF5696 domain-containing protein n=1 Tax=Paenibacillus sp. FA6 TaxID=3413029 RepID=UPI003F655D0A
MTSVKFKYRLITKLVCITIVLVGLVWMLIWVWNPSSEDTDLAVDAEILFDSVGVIPVEQGLPVEERFKQVAETESLKLLIDSTTAHFQVINKSTGKVWRSYPDPQYWDKETVPTVWKNNLSSPVMVEYVNVENYKSLSITTSLIEDKGYLENFKTTENGFTVTFVLPKVQFKIPIEVSLKDDYVETRIVDSGIIEGKLSLLNVKLYPLFGAQPSVGQDGYIMLPDGLGALIRFDSERIMQQLTYNESVYGNDLSFYNENTDRQRISMPVFGLKSGDQAFLAVVAEGEPFANIYAAPSGAVGASNWVTTEWQYRKRFFQSVSKSTGEGFYTYSGGKFVTDKRATRYYPLAPEESDYVGMAAAYRRYLIDVQGVKPLEATKEDVPLYIDIVGGDIEKGLFLDSYLKGTTTDEATTLVNDIYKLGMKRLSVNFIGWQQDGYSTHGGYFPVDRRIGGTSGMKDFISFAHSLDIPVYLTANYTLNNNGDDHFWWRRDGLRNLAGTVLEDVKDSDQEASSFVSPKFYEKVVTSDLDSYKKLGADGIYFEDGIGQQVNTDFNSRYVSSRVDIVDVQRSIFKQTIDTLGSVTANNVNFYALDQVDHVHRLTGDYSYDVFISEEIPFAQIVLHGLRTYTLEYSNLRNEFDNEFLRNIEYGAYPTYVFTGDAAADFKNAYSLWYYSLNYKVWIDQLTHEYTRVNEALAAVQDQFITGHHTLAPNVKETVYGDQYRIIVNYNLTDYSKDGLVVPAKDFVVIKGGTAK